MSHKSIFSIVPFLILIFSTFVISAQKTTSVQGKIIDSETKETMLYVNVQFENTTIGAVSDIDGNFYIETEEDITNLVVSYIGYKSVSVPVKRGVKNTLNIEMEEEGINLQSVEIKVEKYKNKDNPAVELINKVLENRDRNKKESFSYYSYNKHEKMEFALNNVTEKMKNNFIFKRIKFVFDNVDSNNVSGKVTLPIFLRESISDVYYRNNPNDKKEYIHAERITNIDELFNGVGLSNMMTHMYQEVDFYDNQIMLLTNAFVSPISPIAPSIYRFYIQDTTVVNGTSLIHMYFAPRTKSDLAFIGHLWIANDGSYALRKIDVGIPKDINLNWVREMQISQEFDWVVDETDGSRKGLMLSKDDIFIDFGLTKKEDSRSVLGKKTTSYKNISVNHPIPNTKFNTTAAVTRDIDALTKPNIYWTTKRHDTLSVAERGIYITVDSLNNYKPFKRAIKVIRLLFEGYTSFGGFDLGPANTFYSFNPIEGFRMRLGGRTNFKLSNQWMIEAYGAYGTRDKKLKGYAALKYNFGDHQLMRFPYNQLKVWYQDDIKIPGQDLQFVQEDNIFLSFKRGLNDKMIYTATMGIEYLKEYEGGFSYSISAKNVSQRAAGNLLFDYDTVEGRLIKSEIISSELGLMLRYAPNEKFYEGATYRTPMLTKYPIFEFRYNTGIKEPSNGEYSYHHIHLKAKKAFYMAPFGYSELIVEGGRIFGQVPYTLLTQHRANQTYAYQLESYNLMNFLEFVSDKYVSVNYQHNFQGVFLGRMPLIKKLNWREVITFKSLWGGLDEQNIPNENNQLLRFPVDENGQFLTQSLGGKPYIEASVGVSNIFRVLRIDYVRRLNYTDLPNVRKWGIRARVKFEF